MSAYHDQLARRRMRFLGNGEQVSDSDMHDSLKPFQRHIVKWACANGRAAIWADTGLGKTRMQIEWCRLMADTAIIIAPLAVAHQTVEEAAKIGVHARYVRDPDQIDGPGLYVVNYEMLAKFDPRMFGAVALDEASILKQSDGKTRSMLIEWAEPIRYKTSWTATPAPNDPEELTNQAEFLGVMKRVNMLAAYYVHDQDGWRLKGHAFEPFIDYLGTWALAIRRPSDLGFDDTGYILPGLEIIPEIVTAEIEPAPDELFAMTIGGVTGRSKVRRETLEARIERAVSVVEREPAEPWLMWCDLNDEAEALAKAIPGSVNVHGSMRPEEKADKLLGFAHGDFQTLITKPGIASLGLNYQHCARMQFVGMKDSYEQYYQAMRRCYRYGQTRVVNAHIVLSEIEQQIAQNVARKEKQANRIVEAMIGRLEKVA